MKIIKSDIETVSLELSLEEFHKILSSVTAVMEHYELLNPYIVESTEEEIVELYNSLSYVLHNK